MCNISLFKYLFFYTFIFLNVIRLPADSPINILHENAVKTNPVFFRMEDDFILIGEVTIDSENIIIVAYNKSFWGNGRMTGRILIFNSFFQLIGMYGTITGRPRIEGKILIFPFPESDGNIIDFSSGIPSVVRLDGYIYRYESIETTNLNVSIRECIKLNKLGK